MRTSDLTGEVRVRIKHAYRPARIIINLSIGKDKNYQAPRWDNDKNQ